jgi:hypothetical protein
MKSRPWVLVTAMLLSVAGVFVVLQRREGHRSPRPAAPLTKPLVDRATPAPAPMIRPEPLPEPRSEPSPAIARLAPAPVVRAATAPADLRLLPGFVGTASWENRGTDTPSAAFETHCWAIIHGDIDALVSTVTLTPASRAKLQAAFDRLSATDQASVGSPERILGILWVRSGELPFPGFMIQSENVRSPDEVGLKLQLQYGQQGHDREFVFQRHPDGWRKVTADSQVENFLRHFQP